MKAWVADALICSGAGGAVVGLGFWMAGPTFGAILWASAVLPVTGLFFVRQMVSTGWQTAHLTVCASLPCVLFLAFGTAGQVGGQMAVIASAAFVVAAGARCLSFAFGLRFGRSVSILIWAIWYAIPVLNGPTASRLAALQPIITSNGIWPQFGDWSHQAIAYTTLTRLGQDNAFELSSALWPIVMMHGLGGLLFLAVSYSFRGWGGETATTPRYRCSTWNI